MKLEQNDEPLINGLIDINYYSLTKYYSIFKDERCRADKSGTKTTNMNYIKKT